MEADKLALDALILLKLHSVKDPSELFSVDISEQKLNSVKAEDLKVFKNVTYIDASVNCLNLGSFSCFPSLRELGLSLNGIKKLKFDAADFSNLQELDLSYNKLSSKAVTSLSWLPCLRILRLTGNGLRCLPSSLDSPDPEQTTMSADAEKTQFEALEVLMLDDNKLSSEVFVCLANLKKLTHLNLQKNRISEIPYLQKKKMVIPLPAAEQETKEERSKEEKMEEEEEEEDGKRTVDGAADSSAPPPSTLEDTEESKEVEVSLDDGDEPPSTFPELQFLNIADNEIMAEEDLVAASLFPKLVELDIHDNPLVAAIKGKPLLLISYLEERLHMRIKWHKSSDSKEHTPKGLGSYKTKFDKRTASASKRLMSLKEIHIGKFLEIEKRPTRRGKRNLRDVSAKTKRFLLTQRIEDKPYPELDEVPESARESRGAHKYCRRMMNLSSTPDVLRSLGIQTAVRMLDYTLKNLNVYPDSTVSDSIQTTSRSRKTKMKSLPPLKAARHPAERVDAMLKLIKESSSMTILNFANTLKGRGVTKKEQKEAKSLFKDLKIKYQKFHEKAIQEVASLLSDGFGTASPPSPFR